MIFQIIKTPFVILAQIIRLITGIVTAIIRTLLAILRFVFVKGLFIAIIGAIAFLIGKKHRDNKKS